MLITLKTTVAGPDGTFQAGQTVDMERGQAYGLIEGGYAVQVGADEPEPEVAAMRQPETATVKTAKSRR
jgi:hypothetical protein